MMNLRQAQAFIRNCMKKSGGGFHPDTPFENYCDPHSGTPIYKLATARKLNKKLQEAITAFKDADKCIYEYSLSISEPLHEPIPKSHPVQPLPADSKTNGKTTCSHCKLSWDNNQVKEAMLIPSGRCPFEQFHIEPPMDIDFNLMATDDEAEFDLPDATLMVEFKKWNAHRLRVHISEALNFLRNKLKNDKHFEVKDATICT